MEFLREKIDSLDAMIRQFSLEKFQNEMLVKDAEEPVGDPGVDHQLQAMAENAAAQVLIAQRRIAVRNAEKILLNAELGRVTDSQ